MIVNIPSYLFVHYAAYTQTETTGQSSTFKLLRSLEAYAKGSLAALADCVFRRSKLVKSKTAIGLSALNSQQPVLYL